MKKTIQYILKILAILVLKKYKPDIIGITGSVGKTSTKEAVYMVLNSKFKVRRNVGNYNNEIGMPLTILGCETGNRSVKLWLAVFFKSLRLILGRDRNYPRILVLEMGADRPGDIKYLMTIIPRKLLRVGIVTAIAPVHLEFFGSLEKIAREKRTLVAHLLKENYAVINCDDEVAYNMKEKLAAKALSFGFDGEADIKALELVLSYEEGKIKGPETIRGISFKLKYQGSAVPVHLPGVLGRPSVTAALAGAAVGVIYGLNLVEISEQLRSLVSPPGRMKMIRGIKHSLIIDDTYNASPISVLSALDVMKNVETGGKQKFAVLADMLELGEYTEEGHKEVGKVAAQAGIDHLVTVGERAKGIAEGAEAAGMPRERIFSFADVKEAGKFVQDRLEEGDLILVKGSQLMRMEKIVKELMAEPLEACRLLVRQDSSWMCKQ